MHTKILVPQFAHGKKFWPSLCLLQKILAPLPPGERTQLPLHILVPHLGPLKNSGLCVYTQKNIALYQVDISTQYRSNTKRKFHFELTN